MEGFLKDIKIPELDENVRSHAYDRWALLSKNGKSLGELEHIVAMICAMTGKMPEKYKKAMILIAGDHGIAQYGVSNFPQQVTVQMIEGYLRASAGANVLARHAGLNDADIFIVDIGVKVDLPEHPQLINKKIAYGTEDFTKGPAMTRENALQSIKAGFDIANMCIDDGYRMLILSEMGIGNTTASAAIASVFTGLVPEKTVGRGTGIGDNRLVIKQQVVRKGLEVNQPNAIDALGVLAKVGGYEFGGLVGVILAGAARRVPVFIDGVNATASALIAWGLCPNCKDYMLASHLSAEIAHSSMLALLGLKPVLTANMRLGEGTGASVFIRLLDAAIAVFQKDKQTEVIL